MKPDVSVETKKLTVAKLANQLLETLNDLNDNNKDILDSLNEEVFSQSDLKLEDLGLLLATVCDVF